MEVCPHHLFMTHKDRERYGAFCCMKPELATQKDCDALWEGVLDGTIDCFATDHAPHTKEEKESSTTYYGIPGVETFFHLLYTEFVRKKYDLKRFSAMTSLNVYSLFDVKHQKGLIQTGYDADLVLVDPEWEGEISPETFYSKCRWTPFEGRKIKGKIEKVWINGTLGYDQASRMFSSPKGKSLF